MIGRQTASRAGEPLILEGDFVEAPSQMLEEFFHDYGIIAGFAQHYQTGEVLPKELCERMVSARSAYGRAAGIDAGPLLATAVSLRLPHRGPGELRTSTRLPKTRSG